MYLNVIAENINGTPYYAVDVKWAFHRIQDLKSPCVCVCVCVCVLAFGFNVKMSTEMGPINIGG
jgi:hypothetical protein